MCKTKILVTAVLAVFAHDAEAQWRSGTITNKLTDETAPYTSLSSSNRISFKFPYHGENRARLLLFDRGSRSGIQFFIDRGQILCPRECTLSVRFNDGPVEQFSASALSDGDPTAVVIDEATRFLGDLYR